MKLPIAEFVKKYSEEESLRFHMPGHKGRGRLGIEQFDITEIPGADSLYEAEGIIAESERTAARLFGSKATFFSTEGSSQCIKAMLHLILMEQKNNTPGRPYILAARNVHKAFLYGAALLDLDVQWLWPEQTDSLCSCIIRGEQLQNYLETCENKPIAVYLTSPDYLGNMQPIKEIARICHQWDILLAVDNAHGAYLHFLGEGLHPLDSGADLCCDSAHKTLPVLTGGAYLHIGKRMSQAMVSYGKLSMIPYGSTSPSYLTLMSMDLCNDVLADQYEHNLEKMVVRISNLRENLRKQGWEICASEPMKITIHLRKKDDGSGGTDLQNMLRSYRIQCEYADREFVVFMFSVENTEDELKYLETVMKKIWDNRQAVFIKNSLNKNKDKDTAEAIFVQKKSKKQILSIREAVFSRQEMISAEEAEGRICGTPVVGCPPAIPIIMAGERIEKEDIKILLYYNIKTISVVI